MNGKAFIHLFKTPRFDYMYDVNKNVIARVDSAAWNLLKKTNSNLDLIQECRNEYPAEYEIIKNMEKNGFLLSNKVDKILHPADEVVEYHIENKITTLNLQVTQQCNLRCNYCVYSGGYDNRTHSNKRMTFDIARKGIDFLLEHNTDMDIAYVGFYGGEPLMEFNLIRRCVDYINENSEGKNVHFSVTTNATLINEEIIEYFYKNNIHMLISLDGPSEIHNKNRKFAFNNCGTFDKVIENINLIKKTIPDYLKNVAFNAVMDQENDASCVTGFFNNCEEVKEHWVSYSEVVEFYSKDRVKRDDKYYEVMNYEFFKFLLSKLGKLDPKYTSKLMDSKFTRIEKTYRMLKPYEKLPEYTHHSGPCIPGAQRLFLNALGDFFPCERVSETSSVMKIGDVENGLDINKIKYILNVGKISEEKCKNCWAIRLCSLCGAAADNGNELSEEIKSLWCNGVRFTSENMLKDICALRELNYKFPKIVNT